MTTDIDPAFAERCAIAAANLSKLAELGTRPDTDANALMGAGALTAALLGDPEALLAVALTIEQGRAGAPRITGVMEGPIRIEMEQVTGGIAARAVEPRAGGARVWATAFLSIPGLAQRPHSGLAAEGFHRIGRIDAVGRRSLWLREELGAVELRAGREGDDARVRITTEHPLYRELASVLSAARFAAEWEDPRGHGLDDSFALDRCPASVHRVQDDDDGAPR